MTRCPDREALQQFLDSQLAMGEAERMDAHIDECPSCQETLSQLTDSAEVTRNAGLHVPPLPAGFHERLEARIAASIDTDVSSKTGEDPVPSRIGEYRVIRELGRGGMGTVFLAEHDRLKRLAAVKILNAQHASSHRVRARFLREMAATGGMSHPNIVMALDAGEIDGLAYIAMEYLPGRDAGDLVRNGQLSVPDACEIIRQAALGLCYAHENGVVHRDVKPSNLMVTPEGNVKLLDLGLARNSDAFSDELTVDGEIVGTPRYMAPEQLCGSGSVGPWTDIFSLAATLCKLLGVATIGSERRGAGQVLPEGLEILLDQMLTHQPHERIGSAQTVATAIAPFCGGARLESLLKSIEENHPAGTSGPEVDTGSIGAGNTAPTGMPREKMIAATASQRRTFRRFLLSASAIIAFVLSSIIYVRLGDAILIIAVNDPDIRVTVDEDAVLIRNGSDRLRLRPGVHTIHVTRGDFEFETTGFALKRGEKEVLSIEYVNGRIALLRDDQVIASRQVEPPRGSDRIARVAADKSAEPDRSIPAAFLNASNEPDRALVTWLRQKGVSRSRINLRSRDRVLREFDRVIPRYFDPGLKEDVILSNHASIEDNDTFVVALQVEEGDSGFTVDDLERFSNLRFLKLLSFHNCRLPPDAMQRIHDLPSLQSLDLYGVGDGFTDASVPNLGQFAELRWLQLCGTALSPNGFHQLTDLVNGELQHLNYLSYQHGGLDDRGYAAVSEISTLEHLRLQTGTVSEAGLSRLIDLPLQSLDLSGTPVTDDAIESFLQMRQLNLLQLRSTAVTPAGLARLNVHPSLLEIDLRGMFSREQLLELHEHLPRIKLLTSFGVFHPIRDDAVDQSVAAWLQSAIGRGWFDCRSAAQRDDPVGDFDHHPEQYTDLQHARFPDGEFHFVAINLRGISAVNDSNVGWLSGLKYLKRLNLRETAVTDTGMQKLSDLPHLEALILSETAVSNGALQKLERFPTLTELDISATGVSDDGIAVLQKLHAGPLARLSSLRLRNEHITDASLAAIGQIKGLRTLDIGTNGHFSDDGVASLQALPLESLTIYRAPRVTAAVIDHLLVMPKLTRLELRDMELSVRDLARLGQHNALRHLDINCERYTEQETISLQRALPDLRLTTKYGEFAPP